MSTTTPPPDAPWPLNDAEIRLLAIDMGDEIELEARILNIRRELQMYLRCVTTLMEVLDGKRAPGEMGMNPEFAVMVPVKDGT